MMDAALSLASTAVTVCRHCGDPCTDRPVRRGDDTFCCRGCASVYLLLHNAGLAAFYDCEAPPGVSQRRARRRSAQYAVLDDPAVATRLVAFDAGEQAMATFDVPDLHCASCLWLIERLWRLDSGIIRADADLTRRVVRVWFRPSSISLRGVAERLSAAGYPPVVPVEGSAGAVPAARRGLYLRLAVAGFAFGNIMLFSIPRYVNGAPLEDGFQRLFDILNVTFALPVLLYSASGFFTSAWQSVRLRKVTLDVPIAIGLVVMFARSIADIVTGYGEGYLDSFTGLVFFLLIGRLLQQKAFDRIAFDRSFRSFMPLSVLVRGADGLRPTPIERLTEGDTIVVRPYEVVPADAELIDANGAVDYAFVTGESRPVALTRGDAVRAGGRVVGRSLTLTVVRPVSHSRLAALWNNPAFARPKRRWLTDVTERFGAFFTTFALLLATAGAIAWWPDARMSASVATAVLIIACPCAITLAAPITLGTAMELFGRVGLYLKHGAVALDLARTSTIVFDKTGTLTTATDGLRAESVGLSDDEWRLARRLAAESVHPISRAMAAGDSAHGVVTECAEHPGGGVAGSVDGRRVVVGSPSFIQQQCGVTPLRPAALGPSAGIAIDGTFRGWARLIAPPRDGIEQAVARLGTSYDVWLLSGDRDEEAVRWRRVFSGRAAFSQAPDDKLVAVAAHESTGSRVLMVGDGLNDAGALAAANVGMAVSDDTACMVPACDAVIQGRRLPDLPVLLRFARRARQVVIACFAVSILYNVVGLSLALAGRLTPLATAILMPISSLTILAMGAGGMRWFGRALPREAAR